MIGYLGGYRGLLKGESVAVTPAVREGAAVLQRARRLADRQQPRQAHQRRRCGEARAGQGGRAPARRSRPSSSTTDGVTILHTIGGDDTSHHRRRPREISRRQRLRSDRRRAAQDGRQRHRADPPVDGRDDRRRAGRDLLRERRQRGDGEPAHAGRPRGDGAELRLAHRRDRARLERERLAALEFLPEFNLRPERQGDRRDLRAGAFGRHRGGGRAAEARHGRERLRQRLRQRGGERADASSRR